VLAEARIEEVERTRFAQEKLLEKHQRVEELLRPLHETIEIYQREARDLAAQRQHESGRVSETLSKLTLETQKLSQALRNPQARGRWGELTLRRTAEMAGLAAYCDFTEQKTLGSPEGRARPDMIVHLPGNRAIAIDAKVPLDAFLDAMDAQDEAGRRQQLQAHARQLKRHVEFLSSKSYHTYLSDSLEFVVLFLPNDSFLSGAAEADPGVIEFALSRNIVLATPATFFALLAAIAQGWKQERMTENAEQVCQLAQEMHDRLSTFVEHLRQVGNSLDKVVEHYNAALGSFSSRLLPHARKLEELGVSSEKPLDPPNPIKVRTRVD